MHFGDASLDACEGMGGRIGSALSVLVGSMLVGLSAFAADVSYTYDDLGRVVRATYPGNYPIDYVYDANGNRTSVAVTGGGGNQAPTANADSVTAALNTPTTFDPRTNDSDPENDTLTITAKTDGTNGTVVITGGTSLTYTPNTSYSGPDSFTYTISDGNGNTAVGNVSVTMNNQAPTANADSTTTTINTPKTFDPRVNDTDPENDTLTITAKTNGANGTVVINGGASLTYTPNTNYYGPDSFTYTISDGNGNTAVGNVSVTMNNQAPTANADSISTAFSTAKTFDPRTNDTDPENNTLTITAKTNGANGTVAINGGTSLTYTPLANCTGTDNFTYTISDGTGNTAVGNVTATVTNLPPIANPDSYTMYANNYQLFDPRINDSDPEGSQLFVVSITNGAHGTVTPYTLEGGYSLWRYTPNTNYTGSDVFTYTLADLQGATATGTVSVTINSGAPVAVNDVISTSSNTAKTFDPRANDSDPEGDPLTIVGKTNGAHGTVVINGGTSLTYTPATNYSGPDSFAYTISDGHGNTATGGVSVTMNNLAPTANADSISTGSNTPKTFDPRTNDTDPENNALTIVAKTNGANGTVVINGGTSLTYTPNTNWSGINSFTYTISDGYGNTAVGTVTVTVSNGAPTANPDSISTTSGAAKTIDPRVNDTDPEGNALTIIAKTNGAHGAVVLNGGASLTYTPNAGYVGSDSFSYTISDGYGNTAVGSVSVTIIAGNQAPTAVNDNITVPKFTWSTFYPTNNDSDIDNDPLSIVSITSPSNGVANFTAGSVSYRSFATYVGPDSFTYTISDGHGHTATATISVLVTGGGGGGPYQ